jgi:hypothetical protein
MSNAITRDLESEIVKVRSSAAEDIAALEARIWSIEAHSMDVATASEKHLRDLESDLIKDLAGLRSLYVHNIQSIGGMCSSMPVSDPSAADYIRWLSAEVTGLPLMFASVNENFVSTMVKGALVMAGDSIDLVSLQDTAADSGVDILPTTRDQRRDACTVSKKWWRSFGYDYVLATIWAKLCEVAAHV